MAASIRADSPAAGATLAAGMRCPRRRSAVPTLRSPRPPRMPPSRLCPASPANGRIPGLGCAAVGAVRGGTCDATFGVVPRGADARTVGGCPYAESGRRSLGTPAAATDEREVDRDDEPMLDSSPSLSSPLPLPLSLRLRPVRVVLVVPCVP